MTPPRPRRNPIVGCALTILFYAGLLVFGVALGYAMQRLLWGDA